MRRRTRRDRRSPSRPHPGDRARVGASGAARARGPHEPTWAEAPTPAGTGEAMGPLGHPAEAGASAPDLPSPPIPPRRAHRGGAHRRVACRRSRWPHGSAGAAAAGRPGILLARQAPRHGPGWCGPARHRPLHPARRPRRWAAGAGWRNQRKMSFTSSTPRRLKDRRRPLVRARPPGRPGRSPTSRPRPCRAW